MPGGVHALAIVGCCLPLVAAAASSGTDRLRIRAIAPDEATQFVRGEHWTIYLDGTIDADAADRLSEIIAAEGVDAASVYLNSRGGDLAAGQSVSVLITRYLSDMGASTDLFALMTQIPSEDLYVLQPEEARTWRLVNDGRGVPEWSIEASEAGFYLRGAQDTAWGPGKVALGCVGTVWMLMGFYSVTAAPAGRGDRLRLSPADSGHLLGVRGGSGRIPREGGSLLQRV